MTLIALEDIGADLVALARRVEDGETIIVTRGGKSILDLVPHKRKGGVDFAAGEAFLHAHGIVRAAGFIADDFDAPLPEDFLLKPLPEP